MYSVIVGDESVKPLGPTVTVTDPELPSVMTRNACSALGTPEAMLLPRTFEDALGTTASISTAQAVRNGPNGRI